MKRLASPAYLFVGFFIIALLVMAESVLDLFHAHETRRYIEQVIETHNDKIRTVHEMQGISRQRMLLLNTMLILKDPFAIESSYDKFLVEGNRFIAMRRTLESLPASGRERQLQNTLRQTAAAGAPLTQRAVSLIRNGQYKASRKLLLQEILPLQERFIKQGLALQHYYMGRLGALASRAQQAEEQWRRYVVVFGLVVVLLTLTIARVVIRRIHQDREALLEAHDSLEVTVAQRTAELRETALQLEEANRLARLGHWEWDIVGDTLTWSDEIYRIFGVRPGEYAPSYEAFLCAVHPDDRGTVTAAVEKAINGEAPYDMQHRVVWPDGTVRVVHERGEVRRDGEGRPISMLGTVNDITEHKEVEKGQLLAASVYHNTGDGVMITDADNRIVDVNKAFNEILGYDLDEIRGRNPRMLQSGRHDESFFQSLWASLNETGQWQGEIWDRRKQGDIMPLWMTINAVRDEQGSLNSYVALFRDITKVKENEQSLWQLAHHDPLTGLANRSLMYARLQLAMAQADRSEDGLALLLIDLDGFKLVNDSLGHSAGDELLIKVAEVLRGKVRESDTVVRYAGDEFVILLKGLQERTAIHRIANEIVAELSRPMAVAGGSEAHIGASIGVAVYPTHAFDSESLIAKADQAMYRAKKQGKGQVCFFGDW